VVGDGLGQQGSAVFRRWGVLGWVERGFKLGACLLRQVGVDDRVWAGHVVHVDSFRDGVG